MAHRSTGARLTTNSMYASGIWCRLGRAAWFIQAGSKLYELFGSSDTRKCLLHRVGLLFFYCTATCQELRGVLSDMNTVL